MDAQLQESQKRARCVEALQDACNALGQGSEASYEDARRCAVNNGSLSSSEFHHLFQSALRLGFVVPGVFPGNYKSVPCCCEYCDSPASEDSELEPGEKVCIVCMEIEHDRL